MNRADFEHTIRAAGEVLGEKELIVIGSQAIHASMDAHFEEAQRSFETDIAPLDDASGDKALEIDGSIGEGSQFEETHGIYAQGVSIKTANLPDGWMDRLIPYKTTGTNGVTAHCLEAHDLWISKAVANREKDIEFCNSLLSQGILREETLKARLDHVDVSTDIKEIVLNKYGLK